MSVSKTILLGRCGQNPEVRTFDNGNKVANLSLATSKSWKNKDGQKQEKTSWHNLSFFGKLADIVEKYIVKGSQIYIEGEIDYQEFEKDGIKRYSTKIIVNQLTMLGSKDSDSDSGTNNVSKPNQAPSNDFMNQDDGESTLPF